MVQEGTLLSVAWMCAAPERDTSRAQLRETGAFQSIFTSLGALLTGAPPVSQLSESETSSATCQIYPLCNNKSIIPTFASLKP